MKFSEILEHASHPNQDDGLVGIYSMGHCHELAMAIQRLAGLPIVALIVHQGRRKFIAHVMNEIGEDRFLDVQGERSLPEILDDTEFEPGEDEFEVKPISASDIRRNRRLTKGSPEFVASTEKVAKRLLQAEGILGSNRLKEARTFTLTIHKVTLMGSSDLDVKVWENPSKTDMVAICKANFAMAGDSNLRGFLDGRKVYVWNAEAATHTAVQVALGLEEPGHFDYYRSVANFHVRGYGWQEGDLESPGNVIVAVAKKDQLIPLTRRWKCRVSEDGDGYY